MKSKISFFNWTIYLKDVKLYWPVWLVYFLVLAAIMPCRMFLEFWQAKDTAILYGNDVKEQYIRTIFNSIYAANHIWIIVILTAVTAIVMFNYMLNVRSANMFHAFPVDRTELYGTAVLGGLSFIWIPQLMIFGISLFICLGFGVTCVEYLAFWLILVMGVSFFEYALAVIAGMCTGHLLAVPFVFIIFNGAYYVFRGAVASSVSFFSYGVENLDAWGDGRLDWLSPLFYMLDNIYFDYVRDSKMEHIIGIKANGIGAVGYYFIAGLVLFVLGIVIYKKRHVESVGDMAAFSFFRPFFRWGIGIVGGLLFGCLIKSIVTATEQNFYNSYFYIVSIISGVVIFFFMDMFIQKSFRILVKRRIKELAGFMLSFFVIISLIQCGGAYITNMIPEKDDIEYAFIDYQFPIQIAADELNEVTELQKKIVSDKTYLKRIKSSNSDMVRFKYYMKNGEEIERYYKIPYADRTVKTILAPLYKLQQENDRFGAYLIGDDGEGCYSLPISGYITVTNEKTGKAGSIKISEKQVAEIFEGLKKDVESGKLMASCYIDPEAMPIKKYDDGTYIVNYENNEEYKYYISLGFICEDFSKYNNSSMSMTDINWREKYMQDPSGYNYYDVNTSYYDNQLRKDVSFSESCTNIVQAVIDAGVVKDIEELHNISLVD